MFFNVNRKVYGISYTFEILFLASILIIIVYIFNRVNTKGHLITFLPKIQQSSICNETYPLPKKTFIIFIIINNSIHFQSYKSIQIIPQTLYK